MEEKGFLNRLRKSVKKTRQGFVGKVETLVKGKRRFDLEFIEGLEDILISSDIGARTAVEIIDKVQENVKKGKIKDPSEVKALMQEEILETLSETSPPDNQAAPAAKPYVVLFVGVNGTGKTTSVAKLAHLYSKSGSVLLSAADTFRAAGVEQLEVWADRLQVEIIKYQTGADPSAVVFDSLAAARARQVDFLLIDTAGRLHTKGNLMEELKKMCRIISREIPGAPHEVLLVMDATTGQNGIIQARQFLDTTGVTGIVLTKLDGTAKGGIIVQIVKELKIPVKYIGTGEKMEDFLAFSPEEFTAALFTP
jgi:fused signal recognition particle receptor